MAAKHLFIANDVGLFEHLADGPANLHDLAHHTGIARRRLRIVADAIVDLGLLLVDSWTDPTHTQPPIAALLAGEFLSISGEGDVYSVADVAGWLGETGWQLVEHRPVAGPVSAIVAESAVECREL
jgi:hypothetical protein